jgi:hypothetical protein
MQRNLLFGKEPEAFSMHLISIFSKIQSDGLYIDELSLPNWATFSIQQCGLVDWSLLWNTLNLQMEISN